MLEVTDDEADSYIDRIIEVLEDKRHLLHDLESQKAVHQLNKVIYQWILFFITRRSQTCPLPLSQERVSSRLAEQLNTSQSSKQKINISMK
jgi:hypothetical protein